MSENLKLQITSSLNRGKSITSINDDIKAIEKSQYLKDLKLKITVDTNVLNVLKSFSKQMEKIKTEALGAGKYIEEVLNPDGSKTKRTWSGDMAKEFKQTDTAAKPLKTTLEQQAKSVDKLTSEYAELTKQVDRYNRAGEKVSGKIGLSNGDGSKTRTVDTDAKGNPLGYVDTNNIAKQNKAIDDMNLKRQALIQQLIKMSSESKVTASSFTRMNSAINATKNIEQLKKLEASLNRVETRSQTKFDIGQYQAQAAIKAQNITRTHGTTVDNVGLQSYLASVNALSTRTPGLTNQMKVLSTQFDTLSGNARASAGALAQSGISMGEMLSQAATKFPVWINTMVQNKPF